MREPSRPVAPVRNTTMTIEIDPVKDIVLPGIVAGLLSTAALGICARLHGKRGTAPVSAVSHWLWPQEANQTARPKPRHLIAGLAIHQLMSIGWAACNALIVATVRPAMTDRVDTRANSARRVALASATTLAAAAGDYIVVPKRFTPGFEYHLPAAHIAAVYAAFGAGLVLPFLCSGPIHRRGDRHANHRSL
ncbi:hypothetical protein QCE63_33980 [Caballeronia sp. LZ065]|uniref:hypothetical protein n=1 Tax=Caballeronia sp. LZ065 TaxID=3038571 RepID=UPI00285C406C|nr:hypothetical protein [Caballeronia sp. LZ065]MDR5784429.1 hypothetical protein [Caballeronia sp. LZ065]